MTEPEIQAIDATLENLHTLPCCGIKNIQHEGHRRKTAWLKESLKKGAKAKVFLTEKDIQSGYIEYLPGRYAWRGVEAAGYMFVHCIWTFFKKYKGKGYAKQMVEAVIDEAKKAKMKGVAVVARKKPWLAGSDLFLKLGFEVVDRAQPDYELLVKKFSKSADHPRFKGDWEKKLKTYGRGLTLVISDQCPHAWKFARDIAAFAQSAYKIKPEVVVLKTYQEAQNAPTPYAVFSIIFDGRILADHQISRARFRNIMNKLRK